MFKLDMAAIRKTACSSRLMANPANVANLLRIEPISTSPLAELATLAISHRPNASLSCAKDSTVAALEPLGEPGEWAELDTAYQLHHFKCQTCIAAGRGARYGLRCSTGAALWAMYIDAVVPPPSKMMTSHQAAR